MTVAVLGPGAVGGLLAVRLARGGARVICIARPDTASAITSEGLSLRHGEEVLTARPDAKETLREPVDLLVITVKAPGLEDALGRIEATPAKTLSLLNGLEHMAAIRRRIEGHVVAGTIGLLEAYRETPTRIVQTTPGPVITVAEQIELPGFEVRVVPERELLWGKLARIAPLAAVTSLTQQPIGDLRNDPEWRSKLALAVDEVCAVAEAEGVDVSSAEHWEVIESLADDFTTSAARDVAAGRPSELDAIVGAVVRAGRRNGVPTPTLQNLFEEACLASSR